MSIHVANGAFRDEHGREITLRGFNVSGSAKLAEHGGLPFASVTDAHESAAAMRRLTGANAVRFLITWAWVEPERGRIDRGYLDQVTEHIGAFTDEGMYVYLDYHQDLYSRHLFEPGSRYSGDGAPEWVVRKGYPRSRCRFCLHWGQNMKNNPAVTAAVYDFWHDPEIRAAFLNQAGETMRHLKAGTRFEMILGVDPINEPYAGRYDRGQTSLTWERDLLWPFYQQFRRCMDDAGWEDKLAFVEPLVFWNLNVGFFAEPGGLTEVPELGERYVFNSHFYDARAQSGFLKPRKARDGEYTMDFQRIADRAGELGTAAIVSEFGHPITSGKTPSVLKAMYQSLDSRLSGKDWWAQAERSGKPLSGSQWHWDIYYGRYPELNGEHFSAVTLPNVNRMYPRAVAGDTIAFTYEDRTAGTWNRIPGTMPNVRELVGDARYGVLLWRSNGTNAPTELHIPFQNPTIVTDDASFLLVAENAATTELQAAGRAELAQWANTCR